ncbi:energy-coupling factor transport system substrate-specific component [Granulicatella balaenopterae]|uniref:Energy-coupling factor transport system substrate-specific component n=1 Tax=Granulicatella balaenopterae TaxID=137733 RepID=A0A1H9HFT1_9LACT|nr:MptD family putative ECF transporter S component [Granulicatella balaenopterae]SEQ61180.1 energy-coupling factor transport system substrate-specific component [Granulicatella balaenopterae]
MKEQLKIKDLVLVAAFAVLGVMMMYLLPMPFIFSPYTILISPIFQALFLSIPFFLVATKVNKKWALFIYCLIWGLGGMMPYYIAVMVLAGLIAEYLRNKQDLSRYNSLSISFAIAMLMHYVGGTIIPYLLTKGAEFEMIKQMYGEDYALKMQSLKTIPFMIMVTIAVVVCSFVGSYLAKKLLKKHFS